MNRKSILIGALMLVGSSGVALAAQSTAPVAAPPVPRAAPPAAVPAAAAPAAPRTPQPITRERAAAAADASFDRIDLNHDGKLDEADRQLGMEKGFQRLDTDHDGYLTRDEVSGMVSRMMQRRAAASGAERGPGPDMGRAQQGLDMMFKMADANGDGKVSQAEFLAMAKMAPQGGGQRGGHMMMGGQPGGRGAMAILRTADANKDGVVTKDEFRAASLARFDAVDTNHDGTVSPDEVAAARAKAGAERAQRRGSGSGDMPMHDEGG